MPLARQLLGEAARALARPAQGRLGIAPRHGLDQVLEGGKQRRIRLRQPLATAARTAHARGLRRALPSRLIELAQARRDRDAREPRGARDRRHAAPAQLARFRRRPLPPHALVHLRAQGPVLPPNPRDSLRIPHASASPARSSPVKNNRTAYLCALPNS